MDLSIVTTLYCSRDYLEEFFARVCAAASRITDEYEITFVNDGSPDDSLEVALGIYERSQKARVIDLSRNFGHHKAIMTGLMQARGKLIFLIDCDLEEEPELMGGFYTIMQETQADVVYGVQQRRKGAFLERVVGHLFYSLFGRLSTYPVPPNQVTARLMSKRYVAGLLEHRDQQVYIPGIMAITGFKQVPVPVKKESRSKSTYTLGRKVALATSALTSFSSKPLLMVFYVGVIVFFATNIAAACVIARELFLWSQDGVWWPTLVVSVWLLGGLTIGFLGIIAIYLSKILSETTKRPYVVIRQEYE
jgi:putative glycosyltransferase